MGILLGLLTALSWGSSDFLARFATHRIGTLRTVLYMQFTGLILLTIALPFLGGWGHLADGSGWQPWGLGVLAGILNCGATLALYRSFEVGKLAAVAPISASYPVLTVLLSLFSGEHLKAARAIGMACSLLGVVLVAAGEETSDASDVEAVRRNGKGIGWALSSAIGFGFLFWLLGTHIVARTGAIQTVWLIRLTSSVLTAILILAIQKPIQPPSDRVGGWILGMGLTDTGAFVMNNFGMQVEQVAVVSVLASLYGAVTVGLAAIFLREHISRRQWFGIVAIFAGIVLISR
jgi:drug/metabolite transporter (DMT)-like permease